MENHLKLGATKRDITGKKSRFLRRQGITPAHVFGHNTESLALECKTAELERIVYQAGTTRLVSLAVSGERKHRPIFIREVQSDPVSRQLIHVDFYQVNKDETIKAQIPIVFVGESQALKGKGRVLNLGVSNIKVECLPADVPPQVEVDLKQLSEGRAIFVKDIDLGPRCKVRTDPDQLIAKIGEQKKYEFEEVKPKAKVEGEAAAAAEAGTEGEAAAAVAPAAGEAQAGGKKSEKAAAG